MAQPKGSEKGVRGVYSLRVGLDIPRFRGVNREHDPGAIGADEFQYAENVRHDGMRLKSRPGLAKVNGSAQLTGKVMGIFSPYDAGAGGATGGGGTGPGGGDPNGPGGPTVARILFVGEVALPPGPDQSTRLLVFDSARSPKISVLPYVSANSDASVPSLEPILRYDEHVYGVRWGNVGSAVMGLLDRIHLSTFDPRPGQTYAEVFSQPELVWVNTIQNAGGNWPLYNPGVAEGKLWFYGRDYNYVSHTNASAAGQVGHAKIWSWDGQTMDKQDHYAPVSYIDNIGSIRNAEVPSLFAEYRDQLIVFTERGETGSAATQRAAYRRDRDGRFTVITPSGTNPAYQVRYTSAAEYNDVMYTLAQDKVAALGNLHVMSYNGSGQVTSAHTISGSAGGSTGPVIVFNNRLYYGWRANGATHLTLGMFDGTTWTDAHKTLSEVGSGGVQRAWPSIDPKGGLQVLNDELYLVSQGHGIWKSPGTNTSGTWTVEASTDDILGALGLALGNPNAFSISSAVPL